MAAAARGAGASARGTRAERIGDQLRQARQELGAHPGVEAVAIGAAERQQPERALLPERHQRERGQVRRLGAEQELTLRVARLAATRSAAGEQRLEGLE